VSTIVLDLNAGKILVNFRDDEAGVFGEMMQVPPIFGSVHDRFTEAEALGIGLTEIHPDLPVQTVSTGLPFVNRPPQASRHPPASFEKGTAE
jgi:trans-2,3-dihydro-3-hydroxyanthranilate isomerase